MKGVPSFPGPEEKDKFFYKIRDESLRQIHHTRRGAERKDYQNTMENWEQAEVRASPQGSPLGVGAQACRGLH